jgi:FtsP/CotA-like multicopper oxidase with cupredoxin domain
MARMRTHLVGALIVVTAVFAPVPGPTNAGMAVRAPETRAATANDNTASAGTLKGGLLSVSLVVEVARWYPGPDSAPPVVTQMFGEEGHAPSNPGPLLRMPLGTRVDLRVRNALPDTMYFAALCGAPCKKADTLRVAPGATGRLRFVPKHPGTFVYWGATIRGGKHVSNDDDGSQLAGVIVVDSGPPVHDRIFTTSIYDHVRDTADASKGQRLIFAINGKSWPNTERLTYTIGDSVHWRVVNFGGGEHPMHLHGFYFRVESRGDGQTERLLPRAQQPLVVTEQVQVFHTFRLAWLPEQTGNWLFHCHRPVHVSADRIDDVFDRKPSDEHHDMGPAEHHAMTGMGGLVLGITVLPRGGAIAAGDSRVDSTRKLHLVVKKVDGAYGTEPTFGYFLARGDSTDKSASAMSPGPVIALTRGERVAITVVNQLSEPTTVHWHGIELESYYDGIPGWSGSGTRTAPFIAAADSFTAVFTPRLAGTFMYHAHADDIHQLTAGLYGPLIVLEPGQKWDPVTDHVFGIGQEGQKVPAWNVVNGVPASEPMRLKAGMRHRMRFYNMTIDDEADVVIENDTGTVKWTPVAKDGMPVVAVDGTPRSARLHIGPGETFDFLFAPRPGEYRMRVMSYSNVLVSIIVE